MQRVIPSTLAVLFFSLCLPLAASTPGTPGPWSSEDTFPTSGASAVEVTSHMKFVITEVRGDRTLQIWDKRTQERHLVRIADEVPIKARRKKDFDGREALQFADLRPGHKVKMTYRASDGVIVELRVLEDVGTQQAAK